MNIQEIERDLIIEPGFPMRKLKAIFKMTTIDEIILQEYNALFLERVLPPREIHIDGTVKTEEAKKPLLLPKEDSC
jgi:hypothetical protein